MSSRTDRESDREYRFKRSVYGTYNAAKFYQHTHAHIIKRLNYDVYNRPEFAKLPAYRKHAVFSYGSACLDMLMSGPDLAFCHVWEGRPYTPKEWKALFPDNKPTTEAWRELSDCEHDFYWINCEPRVKF